MRYLIDNTPFSKDPDNYNNIQNQTILNNDGLERVSIIKKDPDLIKLSDSLNNSQEILFDIDPDDDKLVKFIDLESMVAYVHTLSDTVNNKQSKKKGTIMLNGNDYLYFEKYLVESIVDPQLEYLFMSDGIINYKAELKDDQFRKYVVSDDKYIKGCVQQVKDGIVDDIEYFTKIEKSYEYVPNILRLTDIIHIKGF